MIVLRGVPSRWFAEPRVSSKPSIIVTHTIFSMFGKIRKLNVAEDDYLDKDANEDSGDLVSGLCCKTVVQFEKYSDFHDALRVLCGRSLQKFVGLHLATLDLKIVFLPLLTFEIIILIDNLRMC